MVNFLDIKIFIPTICKLILWLKLFYHTRRVDIYPSYAIMVIYIFYDINLLQTFLFFYSIEQV